MTQFRLHGANPEKLCEAFGINPPGKIHDFSTNTNVLPWPGEFDADISALLEEYPDDESSCVRAVIAERNRCAAGNVLVTNGSNEAIYLLASWQGGRTNYLLQPLYGEYGRALNAYGAQIHSVLSLDEVDDKASAVWICNPCNPTGAFIENDILASVITAHPSTLFVIDEAYRELMYDQPEPFDFTLYENTVLLRSLTKIYRLCGARIGYVLAHQHITDKLRRRQPTWSVNALAQRAAAAFLADTDYPIRSRAYYGAETRRLADALRESGWNVLPTRVNFFLVETEDDEALISFLLKRGIAVRHTRNFEGLDGGYVRIAARTAEEDDLLIAAMREYRGR